MPRPGNTEALDWRWFMGSMREISLRGNSHPVPLSRGEKQRPGLDNIRAPDGLGSGVQCEPVWGSLSGLDFVWARCPGAAGLSGSGAFGAAVSRPHANYNPRASGFALEPPDLTDTRLA